jgi:CubicO group peptidase (beta-lactamase class C family)
MKDNLKFPDGLVTKFEYNSKSPGPDKNKEAWIMSVSKTFCAATVAIMAADGEFGDNKINATLLDVLNKAESKHPERKERINKYRQMITKVGCGDVTMLELLSHKSGLRNADEYLYQKDANLDPDKVEEKDKEQFRMNVYGDESLFSFDPTMQKSSFAYCNLGFVLAEDMMNLVADKDYYTELKNRILTPLKLDNTKSIYESEEAKKGISDNVIVKDVIYDYNYNPPRNENVREDCLRNTKKGYIALSEGGLCSTVADLEKFYDQLSNLVCGMPNQLQGDSQKIAEIHKYYVEARKLGEILEGLGKNYSLGLAIEDKGSEGILLWHSGGHPGNNAFAKVHMNISIEDFMNTSSNPNTKDVDKTLDVSIKQQDVFARNSILTIISCDYISKINNYFRGKSYQSHYETYGDPSNALNKYKKYGDPSNRLQDYEYEEYNKKARTWGYASQEWQEELIDKKRLPQNFGDFHNRIRKAYEPAQEALNKYVKEHFCDEKGVIDSNKVAKIKNLDDFNKIVEAIEPQLSKAREEISNVFKDCQLLLDTNDKILPQNNVHLQDFKKITTNENQRS